MIYSKIQSYYSRILVRFLCLFCLITVSTHSFSASKVLILGDSLSAGYGLKQEQGWVYLLQLAYKNKKQPIELINASISGETSGGALRRLDAILKAQQPDFVLIELGGNDGLRGFPIKSLQNNLLQLIKKTRNFGAIPAVMTIQIPPNYGLRYSNMFSNSFKKVTDNSNTRLLPFFMNDIAIDKEFMQSDGIHPNKAAQPFIRDKMEKEINNWVNATKS
ncbi:arylesterase [Pseudoalteromonas sp. NBT06-2]|uniref:arylesterase n=1 Tax=Pseudoalteromonas sp. NBT06-2 TaxID=2025950 RepID=UPI000BA67C99|nr:arylesterase [Pseudoalteromonas sp. NBT06-2]PAJ74233.1 arylesterase [Pseudoalteromonas sp. NBT06-2]